LHTLPLPVEVPDIARRNYNLSLDQSDFDLPDSLGHCNFLEYGIKNNPRKDQSEREGQRLSQLFPLFYGCLKLFLAVFDHSPSNCLKKLVFQALMV
jgi:hypothetical protein